MRQPHPLSNTFREKYGKYLLQTLLHSKKKKGRSPAGGCYPLLQRQSKTAGILSCLPPGGRGTTKWWKEQAGTKAESRPWSRADMESAPTTLFLLMLYIFNGVKVFQIYRGIFDVPPFSRKMIQFSSCQVLRETWYYYAVTVHTLSFVLLLIELKQSNIGLQEYRKNIVSIVTSYYGSVGKARSASTPATARGNSDGNTPYSERLAASASPALP